MIIDYFLLLDTQYWRKQRR